jgi:hypothetical protein
MGNFILKRAGRGGLRHFGPLTVGTQRPLSTLAVFNCASLITQWYSGTGQNVAYFALCYEIDAFETHTVGTQGRRQASRFELEFVKLVIPEIYGMLQFCSEMQ